MGRFAQTKEHRIRHSNCEGKLMRTIVHIYCSLDGRISGPFMGAAAAEGSRKAYGKIREEMNADAILYGTTTAKDFAGRSVVALANEPVAVPAGDFAGRGGASGSEYVVAIDAQGEVFWKDPVLRRPGRPDAQVIEIVTEKTPKNFLAYLREKGVAYIVAGEERMDFALATRKLQELFGISTLLVCGGGMADWSFLEAGCVDEVSVVVAPLVSGDPQLATTFDWMTGVNESRPIALQLAKAQPVAGGGVHLLYRVGA